MSKRFTFVTVALSSIVAFLVGLIIAGEFTPASIVATAPRGVTRGGDGVRPAGLALGPAVVNFADVVEKMNAAVVNIDSMSKGGDSRDLQRYFRRGEGSPEAPRDFDLPRQGAGSGFLIDRDGYILTNHHVIDGAQRITVTLADGRTFRAQVAGTDPAIDVALLKINGGADLPEAPLGNSDELRVGEWVCAIGNPLGYVHSVTVGVVSFIGRKLFDPSLDDYIQTDAAINFGNSGGPLINTRGEVIGINSAISSRASNIGFAVPINQAVGILPQLKSTGHVSRGYMGVLLTDVTPALQRSLTLSTSRGALVQDVTNGSPAERAGLHTYDVILDVEGRDVGTNEELIREISARQPGTTARLGVLRDERHLTLHVKLAERPPREDSDREAFDSRARPRVPDPASADVPLGLTVRDLVGRVEVPDSVQGVIVSRVDPTGAAFSASIRRGFVIMEINRHAIRNLADYQHQVAAAKPGDVLALYCYDPTLAQRTLVTVTVE
ncbi:MAG: trypsin-like peptidase domain-containing protein [Acidobacteria bacterium]|nr:trypsin-like peptidase domain-containing protein [Acidobacteriota bacterium]